MDEFLNRTLKDSLIKGTEQSVPLKNEVWANINQAIDTGEQKTVPAAAVKKPPRYWGYAVAIAATFILTFAAYTPEGQAAAKKLKDILLPEKSIVQEIEGQPEKTKVSLQQSSIGYAIYFDEDRYRMVEEDGKDKIVPKTPLPSNYPPVFMEIYQIKDKDPGTVLELLESQLKAKYPVVNNIGEVEQPLKSLLISAKNGNKWNDTIDRYFLIDNTQKGTFVVRQRFFIEAEEGHGARFYHMLKEFRLVTSQESSRKQ